MSFPIFNLAEYASIIKSLSVPNEVHEFVWDIDLETLKDKGFNTIVLDVDNTILSNHQRNLSLQHLNWVQKCKDIGFDVYILSNNRSAKRIHRVCNQIDSHGYYLALKPLPFTLKLLQKTYQFSYSKTIIIGDQVLKDIFLSNWVKAYSILVKPIDDSRGPLERFQRQLELYLLQKYSVTLPYKLI